MLKIFFLLLIVAFFSTSFIPEDQGAVGKVTFPLGNVLVLGQGETKFRKVTFNMPPTNTIPCFSLKKKGQRQVLRVYKR